MAGLVLKTPVHRDKLPFYPNYGVSSKRPSSPELNDLLGFRNEQRQEIEVASPTGFEPVLPP
jgi:hypothetical protein